MLLVSEKIWDQKSWMPNKTLLTNWALPYREKSSSPPSVSVKQFVNQDI